VDCAILLTVERLGAPLTQAFGALMGMEPTRVQRGSLNTCRVQNKVARTQDAKERANESQTTSDSYDFSFAIALQPLPTRP